MTYTEHMLEVVRNWHERDRKIFDGWEFDIVVKPGDTDEDDMGNEYLETVATLTSTNYWGDDISDEFDTITLYNTGEINTYSSYDERKPLFNAVMLRSLASLSEAWLEAVAKKGNEA